MSFTPPIQSHTPKLSSGLRTSSSGLLMEKRRQEQEYVKI
ncbi:hypothetical protein PPL_02922 [Heterostelium album PN500]|uniref:Uncharacterized protein n=1 Tax=Heterostelium pallidum (strain ATCC 26659 / Pp 5 / PN500) TaxID=670386 RepID=D3B3F4_HETP5|nr:hypothetical protein PPL_02922 [Heterostelium album PN500]EFA83852.1 hypothetical protein PPL_02922 [Heterostelium album PN500]|eukprot:XP_020435969.1 hypothetical protein PPL_02922 [Heterostelium album PN500]